MNWRKPLSLRVALPLWGLILGMLAIIIFGPQAKDQPPASTASRLTPHLGTALIQMDSSLRSDTAAVVQVADALAKACPDMVDRSEEIEHITASAYPAMGYYADNLGWTRQLELEVVFANNPHPVLPLLGEHCHYYAGGGARPSIQVSKRVCTAICGVTTGAGPAAAIFDVPSLVALDRRSNAN